MGIFVPNLRPRRLVRRRNGRFLARPASISRRETRAPPRRFVRRRVGVLRRARYSPRGPPADPPGRNPSLWPTPFGEPANQIPNRAKRPDVGANFPAPPPEERGLPRYGEMRATQRAGLALTAFTRSVAPAVGPVGFTGEANSSFLRRARTRAGVPPDPRAMARGKGRTRGGRSRAPAGILRGGEDRIVGGDASRRGAAEGGHAWAGPRMLERDGPAEDRFHARAQAARRGADGTSPRRCERREESAGGL